MFTVKTILAVGNTALLRHWRIRLLTLYIKFIRDDLLVLNTDQGVPSAFRRDFWRLRNVEISVIISLLFAYRDFALHRNVQSNGVQTFGLYSGVSLGDSDVT